MNYAESSYAGPDILGQTYQAHHFAHIAAWHDWRRVQRMWRQCEALAR